MSFWLFAKHGCWPPLIFTDAGQLQEIPRQLNCSLVGISNCLVLNHNIANSILSVTYTLYMRPTSNMQLWHVYVKYESYYDISGRWLGSSNPIGGGGQRWKQRVSAHSWAGLDLNIHIADIAGYYLWVATTYFSNSKSCLLLNRSCEKPGLLLQIWLQQLFTRGRVTLFLSFNIGFSNMANSLTVQHCGDCNRS